MLDDGTTLPADMVVLACGVRPRVDLARASGLPVNRASSSTTRSRPRCPASTRSASAPSTAAARTASSRRSGSRPPCSPTCSPARKPQARYRGSKLYTRLKVAGVDVASMGMTRARARERPGVPGHRGAPQRLPQADRARRPARRRDAGRQHRRQRARWCSSSIAAIRCPTIRSRCCARAARRGAPSGERMVCNCHQVSERALREAIEQRRRLGARRCRRRRAPAPAAARARASSRSWWRVTRRSRARRRRRARALSERSHALGGAWRDAARNAGRSPRASRASDASKLTGSNVDELRRPRRAGPTNPRSPAASCRSAIVSSLSRRRRACRQELLACARSADLQSHSSLPLPGHFGLVRRLPRAHECLTSAC